MSTYSVDPNLKEPSQEFWDAVCDSGSPAVDCDLCGRLNYDSSGEFMDEGELDGIEAKRKLKPDMCVPHDSGIHWGHVDGKQVVHGCPCNKAIRFENFIWINRRAIAKYLKARSSLELKDAQANHELAQSIR